MSRAAAAAGCLAGAALVLAWPGRVGGRLREDVLAARVARGVVAALRGSGTARAGWVAWVAHRRAPLVAAAFAAGAALWPAGPVGAILAGTYAALAVRAFARRLRARGEAQADILALEALAALAADLRAGLAVDESLRGRISPVRPLADQVAAAAALAEETGAPLADLLDRVEADAVAARRAEAAAQAQRAGVRATAWLLAVLPAGGIALGYGIGADPLHVLLRTPVGAACALAALALQLGGLFWSGRLNRLVAR